MTESECLAKMKSPGQRKPGKWMEGVIQILVTHSCDKVCFNCTQLSQLARPKWEMTPEQFEKACLSLKSYFGVVGVFGGNPALSKYFKDYCRIMRDIIPFRNRGLWCNNPITLENAKEMCSTFNPLVSNLNVHQDKKAYDLFLEGWPELSRCPSNLFGLNGDSRHSPPYVGMRDLNELPVFNSKKQMIATVPNTQENRHILISDCDINQHWSAAIGVFRGELRAWFCEIAMSQSIHHQYESDYPDTGVKLFPANGVNWEESNGMVRGASQHWWELPMQNFVNQVRAHCHDCGVPLRGYGELALSEAGKEQVSKAHSQHYIPKRQGRAVELVTALEQLGAPLQRTTDYMGNARK